MTKTIAKDNFVAMSKGTNMIYRTALEAQRGALEWMNSDDRPDMVMFDMNDGKHSYYYREHGRIRRGKKQAGNIVL